MLNAQIEKKNFRKDILSKRREFSLSETKKIKDEILFRNVINDDLFVNAKNILVFVSLDIETDTYKIIKECFKLGKRVATPVSGDSKLIFRYISDFSDLINGRYNIPEPAYYCKSFSETDNNEYALCIVPGLAFDAEKYRIGYGKGYYDKFLRTFKGKSIGICYKEFVLDKIPIDEFDMKVDKLITD